MLFRSVRSARVYKSSATIANANFRLWIIANNTLSTAPVENTPWPLTVGDATYASFIDIPSFITGGAGSASSICTVDGLNVIVRNGGFPAQTASITVFFTCLAAYVAAVGETISYDIDFAVVD